MILRDFYPLTLGPEVLLVLFSAPVLRSNLLCNASSPTLNRPYRQYSWDFPEEVLEEFQKDPRNALRAFLNLRKRVS